MKICFRTRSVITISRKKWRAKLPQKNEKPQQLIPQFVIIYSAE